ncbi:MAG TPA: S41 family peptidase [Pyrinomonadaceae bacterium]|nr:S41 family peptidase [Pyrinomonadaceae bacterium]
MRVFRAAVPALLTAVLIVCCAANVSARQGQPEEQPDRTLDAAARAQVIDAAIKRLNESYVFPEVAKKMEATVRETQRKGEYDSITSARQFAERLTNDFQAVSRDKHLRVRYSHQPIPERGPQQPREPSAEERAERQRELGWINHGFDRVERLPGNVGYIELRGFFDPELGAETVAAAMNFVSGTDALIIDLRRNGGGSPDMVALICSYLFGPEPVHLNDLYWREGDRTDEFWTRKEVAGRRYLGKDVYVLTSSRTFSGAEEFSYNLKNLKRATLVGETTGGGAHPGRMARLAEHFGMFVPTGRAISPVTKTNWEGTGVEPDVRVTADKALKTAHLFALRKQFERVTDGGLKGEMRRLIETLQTELGEPGAGK